MIQKLIIPAIVLLSLAACQSAVTYKPAEDAQDAGRQFIRASLDGDYKKAAFYLLKDTTNLVLFGRQERNYRGMSDDEKRQFRDSEIRPVAIKKVSDSLYSYTYYNSFNTKDTTTLWIVKQDGGWLVDLKSIIKQ